jgi:hypothetical protein
MYPFKEIYSRIKILAGFANAVSDVLRITVSNATVMYTILQVFAFAIAFVIL